MAYSFSFFFSLPPSLFFQFFSIFSFFFSFFCFFQNLLTGCSKLHESCAEQLGKLNFADRVEGEEITGGVPTLTIAQEGGRDLFFSRFSFFFSAEVFVAFYSGSKMRVD